MSVPTIFFAIAFICMLDGLTAVGLRRIPLWPVSMHRCHTRTPGAPWLGTNQRLCALASVAMSGCQEQGLPEVGAPIYEGEKFEIWATEGRTPCGGTFNYMEGWLDAFRKFTGPLPTQEYHRFYWLTAEELEEVGVCPANKAGCAVAPDTIYARYLPMQHEVVHIDLDDGNNSFLSEGFAEVYGGNEARGREEGVDVRSLISPTQLAGKYYGTAGHFVRHALDRYGFAGVYEWMNETDYRDGYSEVRDVFARTIGGNLDELVEEFENEVPNCIAGWRVPIYECSVPAQPWQQSIWSWRADLSCSAEHGIGPDIGTIRTFQTVEFPTAGDYVVKVVADDADTTVDITRCGIRCGDAIADAWTFYPADPPRPVRWTFAAGVYWVEISRPFDELDSKVRVEVEKIDD